MKLESEFHYYTECQLATLDGLRGRKSTAKSELQRQERIAAGMVAVCRDIQDSDSIGMLSRCPRLNAAGANYDGPLHSLP